jgi:hypothetical protein
MIIRFSARKLATVKPEFGTLEGSSVVIGAEMTTRDMTDMIKTIAGVLPADIWQRTVEQVESEEVRI